jgi:hypothetical protein
MNGEQRALLGLPPEPLALSAVDVYDGPSCTRIRDLLERRPSIGFHATLELTLIGRGGRPVRSIARGTICETPFGRGLRLTKMPLGLLDDERDAALRDGQMLRQIIDEAREGHWCIEYLEPVDITRNREDIVSQIFENASVWKLTNRAMARIYDMPAGVDIAPTDVRLYWPRNPQNEQFVGQIVDSGFHIDSAISHDLRADGSLTICENDVRADIQDGFLTRIWGNLRDVSPAKSAGESP